MIPAFSNQQVEEKFKSYPKELRNKLLALRVLIFRTFAELQNTGELEETLKWGQPSYLTKNPKTGSTIRIDAVKDNPNQYAIYVHCQTSLLETFKQMYDDKFSFSGKRAILFDVNDRLPEKELSHCIGLALTYHLNK